MVCDNILEYEMVLANGTIINPSRSEHEDLWKALKGGSSNFGIVPRFTLKAFPYADVWGGFNFYPFFRVEKLLSAFYDYVHREAIDESAASPILSLNYVKLPIGSLRMVAVDTVFTKPEALPAAFEGFTSIWPKWSTAKVQSIADIAEEFKHFAPGGHRSVN